MGYGIMPAMTGIGEESGNRAFEPTIQAGFVDISVSCCAVSDTHWAACCIDSRGHALFHLFHGQGTQSRRLAASSLTTCSHSVTHRLCIWQCISPASWKIVNGFPFATVPTFNAPLASVFSEALEAPASSTSRPALSHDYVSFFSA